VDTLREVIDDVVPGQIDGQGRVSFEAGAGHTGLVDQIAGRALASGARLLGVRRADIPGGGLAAIPRYAF
jgi:hypothetical protein